MVFLANWRATDGHKNSYNVAASGKMPPDISKPVLVMCDTAERPEGIAAGTLKLVGTDEDVIYQKRKECNTFSYCR